MRAREPSDIRANTRASCVILKKISGLQDEFHKQKTTLRQIIGLDEEK